MKINFKLKINDENIEKIEKFKNGYFFNVCGEQMTMKSVSKKCNIIIGCSECEKEIKLKNIQQLVFLNKEYLCRNCRNKGVKNGMYGKKHSQETIEIIKIKNSGENNHFFGKTHTEEAKEKISKANKGRLVGEKNPMYNQNVLNILIEKYGKEEANNIWLKKSENMSKLSSGNKNPMYNKKFLDIWIEKYGEAEALEKYNKWKENVKKSIILSYKNNPKINKKISDSLKGRFFTEEHKKNLRLSLINYINKKIKINNGKWTPHFNINACKFLDEISKIKNVNIQHALNGGEYYIEELGYWVDGYDKDNNVIYEYYEKFHKYKIEKDLLREKEIVKKLNCKFIIIHEGKEEEFLKKIK